MSGLKSVEISVKYKTDGSRTDCLYSSKHAAPDDKDSSKNAILAAAKRLALLAALEGFSDEFSQAVDGEIKRVIGIIE